MGCQFSRSLMGDSQGKGKGYEAWNTRETKMLLRLLGDGIRQGWRDASGCMSKMTVEKKILPVLNSTLGCEKTYKHYTNKLRSLRSHYNNMQELRRFSSGFGWDPISKKFTAPDQVWDDYEKAHPSKKSMRNETFEDYEDLHLVFDLGLATGSNAIGLGEDTDAQIFGVEDNVPCELYGRSFGNNINADGSQVSGSWENTESPPEKLPSKKRPKGGESGDSSNSSTDGGRVEKTLNEMIAVSSQVINLMQQREERQQKRNNIWEAIKEISGLEDDVCYATLNEIHKLGMKDVFVNMSIEERMGWIHRNVK